LYFVQFRNVFCNHSSEFSQFRHNYSPLCLAKMIWYPHATSPSIFSPRISAIPTTRPDWGWGGTCPPSPLATLLSYALHARSGDCDSLRVRYSTVLWASACGRVDSVDPINHVLGRAPIPQGKGRFFEGGHIPFPLFLAFPKSDIYDFFVKFGTAMEGMADAAMRSFAVSTAAACFT